MPGAKRFSQVARPCLRAASCAAAMLRPNVACFLNREKGTRLSMITYLQTFASLRSIGRPRGTRAHLWGRTG